MPDYGDENAPDRQGPGGQQERENREVRRRQAEELNQRLGVDGGNAQSFIDGRNTYEGYLADQKARMTNKPGSDGDDRYDGGEGSAAQAGGGMQSWLGQGGGNDPYGLLNQLIQRQIAEQDRIAQQQAAAEAERKSRADALYGQYQTRAQQAQTVDPNDPIIKGQVDSYRAEQERALRNVRSDAAEGGNSLRPTQDRMATERVSQGVASMQAELLARELGSRRSEIADALSSMGGMLSNDQQAGLQRELAQLDNLIKQQQVNASNRGLDIERELGLGNLALGQGRLGLDTELGRGGLSNDLLRILNQNNQFYGDLGLRGRTQDDYYNLVMRGLLGGR